MKTVMQLLILIFGFASFANAQEITGVWKTIDDESGDAKSYVTIYEKNGLYFGKITKILNEDKANEVCSKCSGDKKNQPIQGMIIISDLQKVDNSKYAGGKILDPKKGKEYHLKIFPVSEEELTIEGSVKVMGMSVGRKQSWYRVN